MAEYCKECKDRQDWIEKLEAEVTNRSTLFDAVVDRGCGYEPSGGEDTDGDCGHCYPWTCDQCPCVESKFEGVE
jgi:hypothetical protein